MNKRERELMAKNLRDEKAVIKELKSNYAQAFEDIRRNLGELMAGEATPSKIYQMAYQVQLAEQIGGIVNTLNNGNLATIEDYLNTCYTNGFVGTMYNLHGQEIPLVLPIDQASIANMIATTNGGIKLSERLWGSAGGFKNKIRSEISRGLSTGNSYANIARNLRNVAQIDMHKAARIARTEGHRVVETSAHEACKQAQDAGADIVKEWNSALDARTRPAHVALNGQLRQLDDPFEAEGLSALYPSGFGRASMDINCRCHVLQRAKWALSDEDLEQLGDVIPADNFNEFAEKYVEAKPNVQKVKTTVAKTENVKLSTEHFPDEFNIGANKKKTQAFTDYINRANGDPKMKQLYSRLGNLRTYKEKLPLEVKYSQTVHRLSTWTKRIDGSLSRLEIKLPKMVGKNLTGQASTTAHELGHLIGAYTRSAGTFDKSEELVGFFKKTITLDDVSDEVKDIFSNAKKVYDEVHDVNYKKLMEWSSEVESEWAKGVMSAKEWTKASNAVKKRYEEALDYELRNALAGEYCLQDIYDAFSGGSFLDKRAVKFGHGGKYYANEKLRPMEVWANYCTLSLTRPDLIDVLKRDQPELVKALDKMRDEILEGVK